MHREDKKRVVPKMMPPSIGRDVKMTLEQNNNHIWWSQNVQKANSSTPNYVLSFSDGCNSNPMGKL